MKPASIIISLLAALGSTASGAILILNPSADSYIRAAQGNQGGNELALIGDTTTANDYLRAAFAFQLTDPALVGATINSVTLRLTTGSTDTGGSANTAETINLHQLTASFTNDGVTWTSRNGTDNWPSSGGDFGGVLASVSANPTTVIVGTKLNFSSAALDSAVAGSLGGSIYLLGKLEEENSVRSVFRIASSDNQTASYRPELVIDFTPIPEPSTVMLLLPALVVFRRRRR